MNSSYCTENFGLKLPWTADLQSCKWQCLMRPAHAAAVPEPGTALEALATSGAGSVELHYSYLFCPALQISTCLIIADRANPCGIAIIVWVQREESTETDWSTLLPQGAFLWALVQFPYFVTVHVKRHSLSTTLSTREDCPAPHAGAAGRLTAALSCRWHWPKPWLFFIL